MSDVYSGEGRGKLILFGEHSVVYGYRALACSVPRGARVELRRTQEPSWTVEHPGGSFMANNDVLRAGEILLRHLDLRPSELTIRVELSVPVGAGLGSSAAMAVALARAACELQDVPQDQRHQIVHDAVAASEQILHGNASGIDQAAACSQGFFTFRRDEPPEPLAAPNRRWLIARVAPAASTSRLVQGVAARRQRHPDLMDSLFQQIDRVAAAGADALSAGDWQNLGELMDINQGLLNSLGVSTPTLERACSAARQAGALGAKLTGAGGGGCVVVLPDDETPGPCAVFNALRDLGEVFEFSLPDA